MLYRSSQHRAAISTKKAEISARNIFNQIGQDLCQKLYALDKQGLKKALSRAHMINMYPKHDHSSSYKKKNFKFSICDVKIIFEGYLLCVGNEGVYFTINDKKYPFYVDCKVNQKFIKKIMKYTQKMYNMPI